MLLLERQGLLLSCLVQAVAAPEVDPVPQALLCHMEEVHHPPPARWPQRPVEE